jgi:orotate phosphoribosyltransferase
LPEKSKYMNDQAETALTIASALLQINAIKLNVKNPFIWVSGIKSPIYCDNRKTLSYPEIRNMIASSLVTLIRREFTECDMIAGVATGAIAHGMLVADRMDKPFIYVRSSAKGHGLANRIEGNITPGSAVVVVEDLVSTGKSSLEAVRALRHAGCNVLGMTAIFSYELPEAIQAMKRENCSIFTLSNFSALLLQAKNEGIITSEELDVLLLWRKNPENYYDKI